MLTHKSQFTTSSAKASDYWLERYFAYSNQIKITKFQKHWIKYDPTIPLYYEGPPAKTLATYTTAPR